MSNEPNDTYKYHFKVGNLVVHPGITKNLTSRKSDHQNSGNYTYHNGERHYWKDGHIVQIGYITTRTAALEWERGEHARFGTT